MAPALRMTRSIKEKLPIFSLHTVLEMVVKKEFAYKPWNIWSQLGPSNRHSWISRI
ncbi:hypothetical protein B0O99DRAFT_622431 [Bisporella sp. PMI_857]|nr:hypothetical protein B0O99DRAFT_622431 [Bisporella sp. PMI_857]